MAPLIFFLPLFFSSCTTTIQEQTSLQEVPSQRRLQETMRDFYCAMGGIETEYGFYFSPSKFHEATVYATWKKIFAHMRHSKLVDMFQIDFEGKTLLSLFSLPRTGKIKGESAILCLPSFSLPATLDPKWILTYLSKGMHVLAVTYEKQEATKPNDWQSTCDQGLKAASWLRKQVDGHLFVTGKSLGTIPAAYVCAHIPHTSLILEQPLALHPLTTKEWLKGAGDRLLVIEHMTASTPSHIPLTAKILHVTGGHFGLYWGENYPVWYENEKDQQRLLLFLQRRPSRG